MPTASPKKLKEIKIPKKILYPPRNPRIIAKDSPAEKTAKKIQNTLSMDSKNDKYVIKCGISGEIIDSGRAKYTYIDSQREGHAEYVHEKYLHTLFTCSHCGCLFKEKLTDNFCLNCISGAYDKYVYSYNSKAETKIPTLISEIDPKKTKFCDKKIAKFFNGKDPASFIYHCGGSRPNLFGIELEYESKNSIGLAVLSVVNYVKGFAMLKKDSTLRDGFEVVSAPADKLTHYKIWDDLFKKIEHDDNIQCTPYSFDEQKGKGVGCGLHIHISKDSMIHHQNYYINDPITNIEKNLDIVTGLAIAKLQTFCYSPNNRKFMEIIAGRKSNMYNNFIHKRGINFDTNGKIVGGVKSVVNLNHGHMDHRTAINFNSSNGKTIEFRIFRSTKNKEELLKNIDFVDAICCFCRTGNASLNDMKDWYNFYKFVGKNRQDYHYLFQFFKFNEDFSKLLHNKENGVIEEIKKEDEEEIKEEQLNARAERYNLIQGIPQPIFSNIKGKIDTKSYPEWTGDHLVSINPMNISIDSNTIKNTDIPTSKEYPTEFAPARPVKTYKKKYNFDDMSGEIF